MPTGPEMIGPMPTPRLLVKGEYETRLLRPLLSKRGKKRRPDAKPPGQPRLMVVTLTVKHNHNGTPYGPGEHRLPAPIAQMLMESEQRVRETEQRFLQPRDALIEVGYHGRPTVRYVRAGYFDQAVNEILHDHAPPGLVQSGR